MSAAAGKVLLKLEATSFRGRVRCGTGEAWVAYKQLPVGLRTSA